MYNAKIKDIEDRISDIIKLATNTTVNAKINEVKNKVPSITNNLVTSTAGTSVENKSINVTDLVKDADYDAEIKEIKSKYFTTCDFHKFMNDILKTKITSKKLVNESGLNGKIKTLAWEKKIRDKGGTKSITRQKRKIINIWFNTFCWSKLLFHWWSITLLNISNALLYFKKTRRYWKNCVTKI